MGILKVAVLFILVSAVRTEDETKAKNIILPGKIYYKKHFIFPQKRRSFEAGLGGLYGNNNFNNLYSSLYNGGANAYGANMQFNQQPGGNHFNGLHGTDFTNIPTVGNYNKDQNHQYGTTLDVLGSGSSNGDYLFNHGNFDHQLTSFPATSHFDGHQKQNPVSYSTISGHKPVSVTHSNKGQFTRSPKGFDFNSHHHDAAIEPITLGSSLKTGFGSGLSSQYGLSQYGSNSFGNFKSPSLDLVDFGSNAYHQSSSPVLDSSKFNFASTSPKPKGFENSYKKAQPTSSPYKSNSYPGLFQSFEKSKNSYNKPAPVKYQFDSSLSSSFHSNHQPDNSFKGHNFQSNGFGPGDFNTFGHTFKPQDFKSVSFDHFKTNTDLTSFGHTNPIKSFGQQGGYQFKSSPELSYSPKPFKTNAYHNYAVTETPTITVPGYKEYGNYQTIKPEHFSSPQLSHVKSPLFSAGKGASSEYGLTHDANGKMSAYVSVSHGDSNYNYSIKN